MERMPSSSMGSEQSTPMIRNRRPYEINQTPSHRQINTPNKEIISNTDQLGFVASEPHIPVVNDSTNTQQILTSCPSPQNNAVGIDEILSGQLSTETKRAYRSDLKHFLGFIGHPDALDNPMLLMDVLSHIDRIQAAAYRDHMLQTEHKSAATVNRYLSTISMVFEALREEGIVAKNPFSWVKRPRVGDIGKTPAFTKEQAEQIISQPDITTPIGRRDRIILLLMFFCGLRRSEVAKVEKDDFYETQGHVMLRVHGKGRSDKTDSVMIPPRIWPELHTYLENKEGLLFTAHSPNNKYNRNDKPISSTRIYLLFKKYCHMAGINPDSYSPHSARSTFVTLSLQGGADIRSVMYACRHKSPNVTLAYDRARMNLENHASRYLDINLSDEENIRGPESDCPENEV